MTDNAKIKYDVAISYLSKDASIVNEIYSGLCENYDVFVDTKRQENITFTEGDITLREVYLTQSRTCLIIFSNGWGDKGWTNIEENAIREFGSKEGYEKVFLIKLDDTSTPTWYPNMMFYAKQEFANIDQIIGALKSQIKNAGGEYKKQTALHMAKIFDEQNKFDQDKYEFFRSKEGNQKSEDQYINLIDKIKTSINDLEFNSQTKIGLEELNNNKFHNLLYGITRKQNKAGNFRYTLLWASDPRRETTSYCLSVIKRELLSNKQEQVIGEDEYFFDKSPLLGYCWKKNGREIKQLDSNDLSEELLKEVITHFKNL